jgi:hypothetical protein
LLWHLNIVTNVIKISTKVFKCPQCGAPQNPVSGLVDKVIESVKDYRFKKIARERTPTPEEMLLDQIRDRDFIFVLHDCDKECNKELIGVIEEYRGLKTWEEIMHELEFVGSITRNEMTPYYFHHFLRKEWV